MYCQQCQKEIVVMGVSPGAATPEDVENMRRDVEREDKLALFNPPPVGPHHCPHCGQELETS